MCSLINGSNLLCPVWTELLNEWTLQFLCTGISSLPFHAVWFIPLTFKLNNTIKYYYTALYLTLQLYISFCQLQHSMVSFSSIMMLSSVIDCCIQATDILAVLDVSSITLYLSFFSHNKILSPQIDISHPFIYLFA